MSVVNFKGIKAGDRVRLIYDITVDEVPRPEAVYSRGVGNIYLGYPEDGELVSVAKIAPPLPTEDGWYEGEKTPLAEGFNPYHLKDGEWRCLGDAVPEGYVRTLGRLHRLGRVDD